MLHRHLLILVGVFAAVFSAPACAQSSAYGGLQKWEGFYPTKYADTRPLPAGKTFWDDAVVKASLAAALQPDQFAALKTCWGAACQEERIQIYDNMIAVHVCKKDSHDQRACQRWGAYVFLEMDSGRTSVCWNMMVPGDLDPVPAALWLWHNPKGGAGSTAVDICTSATAYQHVIDQKDGKPIGFQAKDLPGAKFTP